VAQFTDVIRSGIRAEDLPELPPEMQQALEPLLRYVNIGVQGLAQALVRNVSLSDNVRNEVQTVNLDHGVAQLVSLKKLSQAKGVRSISVGSADGKTQQMLSQPLHLVGTTAPNQVKVLAYFTDSTAKRVPVTMELTPEGSYTALTPSDGTWTVVGATGAPAFSSTWTSAALRSSARHSSRTLPAGCICGVRSVALERSAACLRCRPGTGHPPLAAYRARIQRYADPLLYLDRFCWRGHHSRCWRPYRIRNRRRGVRYPEPKCKTSPPSSPAIRTPRRSCHPARAGLPTLLALRLRNPVRTIRARRRAAPPVGRRTPPPPQIHLLRTLRLRCSRAAPIRASRLRWVALLALAALAGSDSPTCSSICTPIR
jgi:hypothetical protein